MYPGGIVKTYNGENAATAQDYIDHTDYWMLESENYTKCGTACFYYDKEGAGEKYVGYWIFLVE